MTQNKTSLELIYDLPTRIFHWLFVSLFLTAILIAKILDDESPWFVFHMLAGLTLTFLVFLRIIWGIFGSKHARFSQMPLNPRSLINYFSNLLQNKPMHWSGHNPASSWAGITLMIFALGLGVTGYLMTSTGAKEDFEDAHEIFANGFIVVSILHVAGLLLHTLRNKDSLLMSMLHGKKEKGESPAGISSNHALVGVVLLVLIGFYGLVLWRGFDSTTNTLNLWGQSLELGESQADSESEIVNSPDPEEDAENEN